MWCHLAMFIRCRKGDTVVIVASFPGPFEIGLGMRLAIIIVLVHLVSPASSIDERTQKRSTIFRLSAVPRKYLNVILSSSNH